MTEKKQKNFQESDKNSNGLFREITRACEGLFYVSETDAPVRGFYGSEAADVSGEIILHQTGGKAEEPVKEIAFKDFFGRLTTVKDWFGEREKARAKKFLDLQKLIEEHLRGIKVFRIGKIRIRIYAVGLDKDGRLVGITTEAVET